MIFVTIGTQDKKFARLLKQVQLLVNKGVIDEEIIVQSGTTEFESKSMKIIPFMDMDAFNDALSNARYIITHGGVGTIMNGLRMHKPMIAVARRVEFGEHENDHQLQIIENFNSLGYVVGCSDVSQLEDAIKRIDTFTPKEWVSNKQMLLDDLKREIGL